MKKNINRLVKLFLMFSIVTVSLVILTVEYFTTEDIFEVLLFRRYLSFPLMMYVLLVTILLSIVSTIIINSSERLVLQKMERSLRALNEGDYTDEIFEQIKLTNASTYITTRLDGLVSQLQEKMILMSRQVLTANEEKIMLDQETKEELLEQERHRIARELHDSVSQQLFASSMMLSALNQGNSDIPESIQHQLATIEMITNESQLEMRALLLHLRPVKLNEKSLKQGIEQLLKELSTKVTMTISYNIEDVTLPISIEDNMFRVIQELLSNVLRHSKASELGVYLKKKNQQIQLRLVDDGVGFDIKNQKYGNYGLQNIRERINSLGGHVKLISFKNQGTTVEIIIPISIGG